jgi:hypothetical protein
VLPGHSQDDDRLDDGPDGVHEGEQPVDPAEDVDGHGIADGRSHGRVMSSRCRRSTRSSSRPVKALSETVDTPLSWAYA